MLVKQHRGRCEENKLPFVAIYMKRKYAELVWDCDPGDWGLGFSQESRREREAEINPILFKLYQMEVDGYEPKSEFRGNAFFGRVTKLSESTARILANEFYMQLNYWKLEL